MCGEHSLTPSGPEGSSGRELFGYMRLTFNNTIRHMSYTVLARRLRPQTLQEVVGQPLVIQAIRNALENNTLHPVYLLTGTRGIGKTTLARVIAKSLNCEKGPHPCLKCDTCNMIQVGSYPDLYEIDAASRTKVEDTREILEHVQYLPQMGKKKVYLIDEVHMLSQHSFNALLKTLEEPPEHTQFILATTEPDKIPKTILSRCLHFNLQPLTQQQIQDYLCKVLKDDGIDFEEDAIAQIAIAGDGSMRDALSLLDQCLAISPNAVNTSVTQSLLNTVPKAQLIEIMQAIYNKEVKALENQCEQLEHNNIDFRALLQQIAELLLETACKQLTKKETALTELWPPEYIQVLYRMIIQGIQDLEYSPSARIGTLMCFIRMSVFYPESASNGVSIPSQPIKKVIAKPSPTPVQTSASATPESWEEIIHKLNISKMLKSLLQNCVIEKQSDDHWHLLLSEEHKHMLTPSAPDKVATALSDILGKKTQVSIRHGAKSQQTPADKQQAQTQQNRNEAKKVLSQDPVLQSLLNNLDVKKEDVTITE